MSRYSAEDKERALKQLREWLPPGATVHCYVAPWGKTSTRASFL
jgi:hypothetical protein